MARRLSPRMQRNLVLLLIFASAIATATGVIFMDRIQNPYIHYYGTVMRKSEFIAQRTHETFCYSLPTFSLPLNAACFDSRDELEQFIATRSR